MGAPLGNLNSSKGRLFTEKLKMILMQEPHRARAIAEVLISRAEDGEPWAIKELFDRIDGKAVQTNTIEDANGQVILPHLQVTFVKPNE